MVRKICPGCGAIVSHPGEETGKKIKCPFCRAEIK